MYIKNQPVAAFYKLALGAVAMSMYLYLFGKYSADALRLFPTWVSFITAWYYLGSALALALSKKTTHGRNPCPVLEGMIIMSFIFMAGIALASWLQDFPLPSLPDGLVFILVGIMPIATLLDWLLFVKKGRWRPMMPFYCLALPITYVVTILFSVELLPSSTNFLYPLVFLDYLSIGLDVAFLWLIITALLVLAVGYILYIIDFAISGRLAKKIVLPHIRTVVVDEAPEKAATTSTEPVAEPKTPKQSKTEPVEIINMTPPDSAINQNKQKTQNNRKKSHSNSHHKSSNKSSAKKSYRSKPSQKSQKTQKTSSTIKHKK